MAARVPFSDERFVAAQRAHFAAADAAHFAWQTAGPWIAEAEAALLDGVGPAPGGRLLEVGCGEGGNLVHLQRHRPGARLAGVDFSTEKARFAAARTGLPIAAADATRLPFCNAAFDAILLRDLLHHLPDAGRARALAEAARVLAPGGRLFLLEPNGRNPIIAAAALASRAERGMLRSHGSRLARDVEGAGFRVQSIEPRQPMPISRVVLHYRLGAPRLGANPQVRALIGRAERAAAHLPRALWAYVLVTASKPEPSP